MTTSSSENATAPGRAPSPLDVVVGTFLAQYKGQTRIHAYSDLACFLRWCQDNHIEPLSARRVDLELYLCWMQVTRRFKPSTVSRRLSVVSSFYRTCVIDGVLERAPTDYVRRPRVPAESPTLGLSHLQFEALLAAARLPEHQRLSPGLHAGASRTAGVRGNRMRHRKPQRSARTP